MLCDHEECRSAVAAGLLNAVKRCKPSDGMDVVIAHLCAAYAVKAMKEESGETLAVVFDMAISSGYMIGEFESQAGRPATNLNPDLVDKAVQMLREDFSSPREFMTRSSTDCLGLFLTNIRTTSKEPNFINVATMLSSWLRTAVIAGISIFRAEALIRSKTNG